MYSSGLPFSSLIKDIYYDGSTNARDLYTYRFQRENQSGIPEKLNSLGLKIKVATLASKNLQITI